MRRMCSENGLTKKQLSLYLEKMKTIRYHIIAGALALLATGCNDDGINAGQNPAKTGDEVQFGLSLPGKDSRTIYGEETSTGFPIYWVNGDLVKVASPQCLTGRNVAEYSVSVENEKQNYATSMTRTGEFGVQWGEANTAYFYSIYPSNAGTELNVNGENVTAKLHVDATQFTTTSDKTDSKGNAYIYAQPAEMGNVVMYAKTAGVAKADDTVVELNYIPFSTVLEFEVSVGTTPSETEEKTVTVQSITLTAPGANEAAGTDAVNIAGDFNFNFPAGDNGPSISHISGTGGRSITLHFLQDNQYTTVLSPEKPKLKAKMCLMPISNVTSLKGWKIDVNTPKGTFSKTLAEDDLTGKNTALVPGKVHKVILPTLSYASKNWEYNLANWMPYLSDYRNIYLSEISLPGAWYAGASEGISDGTGYQATDDIATLWEKGVRAFGIECKTRSGGGVAQTDPDGVIVSGTQANSLKTYNGGTNSANTGKTSKDYVSHAGTNITDIITKVANCVKDNEYAVLVLSYSDGGTSGLRAVDFGAWLQKLYDAYNGLGVEVKNKIYQDGITANTTVNEVLGKLIIKINVDYNIAMSGNVSWGTLIPQTASYTYNNNLPALFSYTPFPGQITGNSDTNLNSLAVPYFSNLSWSTWGDDTDTHRTYFRAATAQAMSNPFLWCFSSANRTHTNELGADDTSAGIKSINIPTYSDRQKALEAMGNFSKLIYEASSHNVWFYFNCGGTLALSSSHDGTVNSTKYPSPIKFAEVMNLWLLNRIKMKIGEIPNDNNVIQPEPSPLGIVMFNQCTGDNNKYYGAEIIKRIVEMNSKFYLKHAGTSGGSTGGSTTQEAQNNSTYKFRGNAF